MCAKSYSLASPDKYIQTVLRFMCSYLLEQSKRKSYKWKIGESERVRERDRNCAQNTIRVEALLHIIIKSFKVNERCKCVGLNEPNKQRT